MQLVCLLHLLWFMLLCVVFAVVCCICFGVYAAAAAMHVLILLQSVLYVLKCVIWRVYTAFGPNCKCKFFV